MGLVVPKLLLYVRRQVERGLFRSYNGERRYMQIVGGVHIDNHQILVGLCIVRRVCNVACETNGAAAEFKRRSHHTALPMSAVSLPPARSVYSRLRNQLLKNAFLANPKQLTATPAMQSKANLCASARVAVAVLCAGKQACGHQRRR